MEDLLELRRIHGNVFISELANDQKIPWRPLSIDEYLKYDKLLRSGVYPQAYVEDEIFIKCVLSQAYTENIDVLRAGIVQQVALDILACSGPNTIQELDQLLNIYRQEANQVIHELVSIVCQAFPAYKPEDVYAMDYGTLMFRVAQAEEKLLRTGLISEPLSFVSPEYESIREQPQQNNIKKPKEDLKTQWSIQESNKIKQFAPPVPERSEQRTVIKAADIVEHQSAMSGHDKDVAHHNKAAQETASIYAGYLEQLKDGKPLRIMTPEERVQAVEKRQEETKKELIKSRDKILQDMAEERKKLLRIREQERERRRKRNNRK